MSLTDLASLGSFISGLAVLVSLVFLYFQLRQVSEQVRQAEKNQRAALSQGYVTRVTDYVRWFADSPINELRTRVIAGDTAFTAEELLRLQMAFRISLLSTQDAFLQHGSGLVDAATMDNALLALKHFWLAYPVYRALWVSAAPTIAPDFRSVVDAMLKESQLAKPVDMVAAFEADLAVVTE